MEKTGNVSGRDDSRTTPGSSVEERDKQFNVLLKAVLNTQETRKILALVIPEVVTLWARNGDDSAPAGVTSKLKMKLAGSVGGTIGKGFWSAGKPGTENRLSNLFDNPEISDALQQLLAELLSGGSEQIGEQLTGLAKSLSEAHQKDPEFITSALEPAVKKWIAATDFGELKEAFENSARDGRSLVKMVNDVIWQYPSKVVTILSFLTSLINMSSHTLGVSVGGFNNMPPDLLTDIVLAYIKEINAESITTVLNETTELIRKIHTGSALLGEPGTPWLPKVLGSLLEEINNGRNAEVKWKAKIGLAEIAADLDIALRQASAENGTSRLDLVKKAELKNIHNRALNRRLSILENMDDVELADSIEAQMTAYDIQEMAESFNNMLVLVNRLHESKPDLFASVISQLTEAVDSYELSETAAWLFKESGAEVLPLARSVVPGLVTWTCEVLKPMDDEYEDDAARAREALRSLLMTETTEV